MFPSDNNNAIIRQRALYMLVYRRWCEIRDQLHSTM